MRKARPDIDYWRETVGGFRGSTLLRAGAVFLVAGALVNLVGEMLVASDPESFGAVVAAAWLVHIAGLWCVGAGFGWIGAFPVLTRVGFVAAAFHLVQGLYLLMILFTRTPVVVAPASLTAGRLIALIVFAVVETPDLGRRTARILATAAGLQLLKVVLRVVGLLPRLGVPWEPALDTILLVLLAGGLYQAGHELRLVENAWARENYREKPDDFSAFNNPEHEWNKPSTRR